MTYELFYLVAGSKENELGKIKDAVKKIVAEEGGVFEVKETTEKRRLAYQIKHETHGIYSAQRFNLEDTEKFRTINRRLNLYPEVLRFLLSRSDELPELQTREERISASVKQEQRKVKFSEPKKDPVKEKSVKGESASDVKPAKDEDIDKQLEEILNI